MRIEPLKTTDVPAALRLSTDAGWNQEAWDWARLIMLWPNTCFGGWLDDELIATGTLAIYPPGVGWIGMILVDRSKRGRGYGGRMMDHLLARADELDVEALGLDASDLGRPVYVKKGFADCYAIDRWVRKSDRISSGVRGVVLPVNHEHAPHLHGLDVQVLGMDRTSLISELLVSPKSVAAATGTGASVSGYVISRPGRLARHIGPLVAKSVDAAADLLAYVTVPSGKPEPYVIDVPRGSPLTPHLVTAGFEVTRRLTRMERPAGSLPKVSPDCVVTAASFELG